MLQKHIPSRWLAGIALATGLLTGCSSIDRSDTIKHAQLAVGVATKPMVVDAIGLPARTSKDEAQKVEFWLYTGKPELSSYFIPMPVAQAGNTVFYRNLGSQNVASGAPVVLICAFDANGRLIDIKRPEEIQK